MFKFILVAAVFGLAAAASLDDAHADIKSLESDISPEGAFRYAFQTSNGIDVVSNGNADAIQGSYKYISPEGVLIAMSYVADAEGYKPSGDGIPTPPPVPEAILRSIAYNAAHPEPESKVAAYVAKPAQYVAKPASYLAKPASPFRKSLF